MNQCNATLIDTKQLNNLQQYVEECYYEAPSLSALQNIRKLGMNGMLTQEIIDTGVVSRLIQLLDSDCHETEIIYEAAWILTNIVAGTSNQTAIVMNGGGHKQLLRLMRHKNMNVRHTSVEALGNIAGDCAQFRDELLSCDILSHLLPLCNPVQTAKILRSATWTLSGLCRTYPQPSFDYIALILKGLSTLLFYEDEQVLCNICWAYSHLLRDIDLSCDVIVSNSESKQVIVQNYQRKSKQEKLYFNNAIKDMANSLKIVLPTDIVGECYRFFAIFSEQKVRSFHNNIIKQMIYLLDYPDNSVKHSALVAFGNMQRYMMSQQIKAIENEYMLMNKLCKLLDSTENNIRRDSCWVISNIIVTVAEASPLITQSDVLCKIIDIVQNDSKDVALEALWAIANSINKYSSYIATHNVVIALFVFLNKINDTKTLQFIMDIIGSVLRFEMNDTVSLEIYQQIKQCQAVQTIKTWAERNAQQIDPAVSRDIDAMIAIIEQFNRKHC